MHEHPFFAELLGDAEVAHHLSAEQDIRQMLEIEATLCEVQAELDVVPAIAATRIREVCNLFYPNMDKLASDTRVDGVVVPGLVRQLREAVGEPLGIYVHFGATSQDIVDTGLVLRVLRILEIFRRRLVALVDTLKECNRSFGTLALAGKTRMRTAIPMTVFDRLRNWSEPLDLLLDQLEALWNSISIVQFAGAVGTLHKLPDEGEKVRARLAERLNLQDPGGPWHVQRTRLGDLANWLSAVTTTLGKMGTDLCLMVQDEIATARLTGGGKSSTMPHKQNPVDAEILVTFARYNAVQIGGVHHATLHEQERSGAMWTLEWMILPQMLLTTGAALRTALRLGSAIAELGDK